MSEQESFLLRVANQVRDHLSVIGRDYRYLAVNEAYARSAGRDRQQMVGMSVAELVGQDVFERVVRPKLDDCFSGKDVRYRYDFQYPGNEGRVFMDVSYFPYRNGNAEIIGAAVSARDVTALKRIEDRYARLAHFDPHTDLANRFLFDRELDRSLARARRESSRFALIHVEMGDLSGFLDHAAEETVESLMKDIAQRLRESTRQNDLVARLSADQFAVLGESVGDQASVLVLASRLFESLRTPFETADGPVSFPVDLGVAIYPDDGVERNDLSKKAEMAMRAAMASKTSSILFAHEL